MRTASDRSNIMPHAIATHEPVGIVIADGGHAPTSTRFAAYVWGPAPTAEELAAIDRLLQEPLLQPVVQPMAESPARGEGSRNAKDAGRQAGVLAFGEPGWVPDDVMATA